MTVIPSIIQRAPALLAFGIITTLAHASDPSALTVPKGFTVTPAASAPLVGHPMMGCFDERGRLFLAESAGFNRDEKQLDATRPNFIRMIEDTDGDGVFDKSTIFADKLTIPNGALWLDGSLYVAEPPGIWRFTDTDDDGVADKREHIAGNILSNGMSSTLHGPVLHPSGRLFWCGGQQGYNLDKDSDPPGGRICPGVFTLKADGSEHENFSVGGMANPVEVTFSENGDVFGTLAILDRPDGARHDALLHWTYGGRFRPRAGVPIPFKPTGPSLPPMSHVGQVAPAGLTMYRGTHFGDEHRGAIFWSQFNTRTVVRTTIEPDGATYSSSDEPFLVSTDIDFHPTDVIEDADGSLLVIDTGGWFRHGCPTSHIAKMDAKGAIYRIRRDDAPTPKDPRGLAIAWDKLDAPALTALLDDPRPAVLDRAMATLARHEGNPLPSIATAMYNGSTTTRRNAVWTLARIDSPASLDVITVALEDSDAAIRKAAAFSLGMARHTDAAASLAAALTDEKDPQVRREVATALGRIGDPAAIHSLANALENNADAFSRHSLIYALIEIGDPDPLVPLLADPRPGVRRGALLALSQMEGVSLTKQQITPLLRAPEFEIREAAFSVALSDSKLLNEAASTLREHFNTGSEVPANESSLYRDALASLTRGGRHSELITELLASTSLHSSARGLLIDTIRTASVKKLPAPWTAALESQLAEKSPGIRLAAIRAIRDRKLAQLDPRLKAIAADASASPTLRLASIDALAPRLRPVDATSFAFLRDRLQSAPSPADQLDAARTLAALRLSRDQLVALTTTLPGTEALILPTLVRTFASPAAVSRDPVGLALVTALDKTEALTSVPADELARLLNKYPESTRTAAKPLLEKLGADLEAQQARLTELGPLLTSGDFGRGKQLFFTKAACSTCHRVSGQGGVLGPNLSTIAEVRSGPDLLESLVYPSASIVQGYEPYIVETKSGEFITGIALNESPDTLTLQGADLGEKNIPVSEIASRRIAPISLMPQGLDLALTTGEFADLMAFLQGLKRIKSFAPDQP